MSASEVESGHVVLAMSTARKSPLSMDAAIRLAAERDTGLVALFALEEDVLEEVVDKLSSEGWIGERPSESFYESAIEQREELGRRKLSQVEGLAREAGVPVTTRVVRGAFEDAVRAEVANHAPSAVVLTRRKRSEMSRFFLGSPAAKLEQDLDVEVVLVDEE